MPPKFKFTRDEIISTALDITREHGTQGLTARSLASRLGSSPKPIFTLFCNMEELQGEVMKAADALYNSYLENDMAEGKYPPYKASGMAYIRFAREEKQLFKLLFMRDRTGEKIPDGREEIRPLLEIVKQSLGISEEEALLFHAEMWLYVHGIATMAASSYLDWDMDFISRSISDVYQGLNYRIRHKEA